MQEYLEFANTPKKHAFLPFTWHEWDGDQEEMTFYQVEFLEDFGPDIQKGRKLASLNVSLVDGYVDFYDDDCQCNICARFKAVPLQSTASLA